MSNTMKERLARAIAINLHVQDIGERGYNSPNATGFEKGTCIVPYLDQGEVDFAKVAEAVLREMLVMSEPQALAMVKVTDGWRFGQGVSINESVRIAWQAAIQAAIDEG